MLGPDALRKTAGSGFAKNECGFTALDSWFQWVNSSLKWWIFILHPLQDKMRILKNIWLRIISQNFLWSSLFFSAPPTAPEAVEAECRVDNDCPPKLACIEAECIDPCTRRPCHLDQTCSVQNSAPLHTVICACPENTFVGPNGECKLKGIIIKQQKTTTMDR